MHTAEAFRASALRLERTAAEFRRIAAFLDTVPEDAVDWGEIERRAMRAASSGAVEGGSGPASGNLN